MKRNCNFNRNPAFVIGVTLMWIGVLIRSVPELEGSAAMAANFLCGAACGLVFIGLLYGSPKTRPLFDGIHAFKMRLLGRENTN